MARNKKYDYWSKQILRIKYAINEITKRQDHKKTIIKKREQIVSYSACTSDVVYDECDGVGNGGVMMILVIVVYGHVGVSKLWGLLFL